MLRQLAGKVPAKEIAARLGRTHQAVNSRAKKCLKISLKCYGQGWPSAKHSDALVEQARTMYDERIGPTVIAKRMGIPLGSSESYVYYERRLGPSIEYYF